MIMISTYTANLVAFLTVVKISQPFTNLVELAAQDKYIFGTLAKTNWEQSFRVSDGTFNKDNDSRWGAQWGVPITALLPSVEFKFKTINQMGCMPTCR